MRKIIVLNGLGIGDIILSSPVLKALREKYPQSTITFLIRPEFEELVKGLPFIDDYILYRKEEGVKAFLAAVRKMWRYDLAVCFDFKYRSAVLPFFAAIPVRAGARHKRGMFLSHPVDDIDLDNQYQPDTFAEIIYRSTGVKLTGDFTKMYLPSPAPQHLRNVDSLLEGIGDFIAVAPFTSNPIKDWPLEYYTRLMAEVGEKYKILILGAAREKGKLKAANAIDMTGKTSLLEMGEIIRRAKLFVGGCSGPLHIANAVGTPIVALYTATSPTQWAPRHNITVLYNKLPCSPCLDKGVDCSHLDCVRTISVDEVLHACLDQLK